MPKVPKIKSEEEKVNIVSFLITNSSPIEMSSLEKSRFSKKARGFVLEEGKLHILVNGVKLEYVCEFEVERIIQICNSFHLPEHLGRNALRELILTRYIGVGVSKFTKMLMGVWVVKERHSTYLQPGLRQ
ncbi:hypothetical protein CDIK_4368 [Cucumispora dikerogammari]|nr:hypothetical protein CDIK_4368 [Cucumispora dikerogammari]